MEQLVNDLFEAFSDSYEVIPDKDKNELTVVEKMEFYYMGTIIVTKGEEGQFSIIDGQQRLTSLTLLLIALRNLAKGRSISSGLGFEDSQMLIWNAKLNKKNFNHNVPQWKEWFESLVEGKPFNEQDAGESVRNILFRYKDVVDLIEQCFLKEDDTIDADLLSTFNSRLRYRVIFIRIETPSEQDAHKVFVSMNHRGLSLNPSEMLKGYLLSEIQDDEERKGGQRNLAEDRPRPQGKRGRGLEWRVHDRGHELPLRLDPRQVRGKPEAGGEGRQGHGLRDHRARVP